MKETEKNVAQRDTRQRRMVYDAVLRLADHPTAEAVYETVHAQDARVSKATVYRNLNLLAENGEIRRVPMPDADRFDHTTTRHAHLHCAVCGGVWDAPLPYAEENDAAVAEKTGFLIRCHETVFEGVCPACRAESEKKG